MSYECALLDGTKKIHIECWKILQRSTSLYISDFNARPSSSTCSLLADSSLASISQLVRSYKKNIPALLDRPRESGTTNTCFVPRCRQGGHSLELDNPDRLLCSPDILHLRCLDGANFDYVVMRLFYPLLQTRPFLLRYIYFGSWRYAEG